MILTDEFGKGTNPADGVSLLAAIVDGAAGATAWEQKSADPESRTASEEVLECLPRLILVQFCLSLQFVEVYSPIDHPVSFPLIVQYRTVERL